MKKTALLLYCFFLVSSLTLQSQNAPVTTAGTIVNATTVPGSAVVPVTVTNFTDIGAFTLTLMYTTTNVTYISMTPNPAFSGMLATNTIQSTVGKIVITWTGTTGITLPDLTHLFDISFTYIAGTTQVYWNYWDYVCQYKKYAGGSMIICNDSLQSDHYINGGVSNRAAPVIFAPVISNATPGTVLLPFTVNDFTGIGALTLYLEYDSAVITYQNTFTKNAAFVSNFLVGNITGYTGKKMIVIQWYGSPVTLLNGSTLCTLSFTYSQTNGNSSALNWFENGPSCEYTDGSGNVLLDFPTADYYRNGLIYTQYSPFTWLPAITSATPAGTLTVPVKVNNFTSIWSFTTSFEYDPGVISYSSAVPNAAFGGTLSVVNNPAGPNGKRKMVISWTGASSLTLPNASSIVALDFIYSSGTTTLAWVTGDATSCRYNDAAGHAFYDQPKTAWYQDGLVASHVAPRTIAWNASPSNGQQVTVPVKVYDFTNIGAFSLTLDYDPGVLTYPSAVLVPSIGGTFTVTTPDIGRIVMTWSGTATSLADSSSLVNLTFLYISGATPLSWYDDGNSCSYKETPASAALYDQPRSAYYINGYIGPDPLLADFTADTKPAVNATVTFTDLTTGSPTGWSWSFTPDTYTYVNGTTSSSQNPQVQFNANGAYTATLVATKGAATSIRIRKNYIHAGTPGLWTGITSTDWNTVSNWHNYMVPDINTDVEIPSSAPNWPVYTGNLILGTHIKTLTLDAVTSQITITGNLILQ